MCNCKTRLEGKTVLVTGGNSGIGFETAKNLAQRGARVIIADVMNAEKSVEEIIRFTGNSKVEYRYLNLANFKSVKAFAEDINITIDHLDILVNNAGCLMDNKVSEDGINMIMQVNYLGPYLLTKLILPKLIPTQSRIVNVSSGMYFCGELDLQDLAGLKPKNFFKSYINSKLCTVLWTKALAKTLPTNVSVFCLHPGMVATNIVGFIKGPIGLGRTGVLIACYLVYSLRIRANDAIRLVRKKRPKSIQTSGQILCVQQFEHYILPQTVVFSSKEPLMLTKDPKTCEFTLRQYLYRQRATLHGLDERVFRELPKIVFCICERLLKLCGCQDSGGLDYRVRNRAFYRMFLSYKLKLGKPPDLTTPEENINGDKPPAFPMIEWRDPVEEDVERNLESVSRYTSSNNIPAVQVYEEKQKYIKQLRVEINQRREAMSKIDEEEDPTILSVLLFEWLEGLKQPVLDKEDLSNIVCRSTNVGSCIMALQMEDMILVEYLLRFVVRLRPLVAHKKVDILKRLLASLTHQTTNINGKLLPNKCFPRLRDGTGSHIINFMLRMIVVIQQDIAKPSREESDVVIAPRRLKIKAWT
ncbi:unnamed protein product [Pieris brassicae]|uniref:Tyrosine specific protein phosphatases domain-containing protein n=1 Tax=Pieris brassicae TaxID=7116 RepID=A0A9P0X8T1_PIEBR|nr:unnamed protein product [Pieris brassicae]